MTRTLRDLVFGILRLFGPFGIAFAYGTGGGALICLYFGIPMIFSLVGGIVAMGVFLFLMSA